MSQIGGKSEESYLMIEAVLMANYGWVAHQHYEHDVDCTICGDQLKDQYVYELPCKHVYDHTCIISTINDYYRFKCPDCNASYVLK